MVVVVFGPSLNFGASKMALTEARLLKRDFAVHGIHKNLNRFFSRKPGGLLLSGPVRDTPHIAQYPFEIVSQRGVSHPFALFS